MPAKPQPIVIRRRWWANLLVITFIPVFGGIAGFAFFGLPLAIAKQQWTAAAILPVVALVFSVALLIALNSLLSYRLELDRDGLRIVGNLYSHRLLWSEIATIRPRHNYRIPGFHVEIQVDGSNNPRRHWSNFWFAGYYVHPLMERGGKDLTRYLLRKRSDWRRRDLASTTEGAQ